MGSVLGMLHFYKAQATVKMEKIKETCATKETRFHKLLSREEFLPLSLMKENYAVLFFKILAAVIAFKFSAKKYPCMNADRETKKKSPVDYCHVFQQLLNLRRTAVCEGFRSAGMLVNGKLN